MTRILSLLLLAAAAAPASALNVRAQDAEAMRESGADAPASTASPASSGVSLASRLQLREEQAEQLDRLYEGYATRRLEQEAGIERRQAELDRAQAPASFDEKGAARLARQNSEAEQKITSSLLAARTSALKVLSSVQRAQLESVAESLGEGRIKLRRDRYFQLLLMPADEREPLPLPRDARTRELHERSDRSSRSRSGRRKGTVSYGAYGGYGYGGPQYGVGASYGRGPVGVHAGIGRGGPSVGVSIGGILGGGW